MEFGYKTCRTWSCRAHCFSATWLTLNIRHAAKQEAGCHPACLQLAKNLDAHRQDSGKTLACEEIWISTGAMRELLPHSNPRRRARVHVSPSDWPAELDPSRHHQCVCSLQNTRPLLSLAGRLVKSLKIGWAHGATPSSLGAMDHSLGISQRAIWGSEDCQE